MSSKHTALAALGIAALLAAGCQSAGEHAAAVRQAQDADRMTVGKVQREIRVGMTSAQVVEALGSPNMVTTDDRRRESWVYDKVSTETVYSSSAGGVNALIFGGGPIGAGLGGGAGGAGASSAAGASSTTQRTLTVIVKFDEASRVRDFSYRSSSF